MRRLPHLLLTHWAQLALLLLGVLLPLGLLTEVTEDVFRDGGFPWDQLVLHWYAVRRTPGWTEVAAALAVLGGVWGLPLLAGVIAWIFTRLGARAQAWFLVAAVTGAAALNVLAKLFFKRPRPDFLEAVLREPGFSFPSGHAMSNMAFGFALALVFSRSRRTWPLAALALVWGVAVGASRNYLGVHYPSDVLAGFSASVAWVTGLYLVLSRRWRTLREDPADPEAKVG